MRHSERILSSKYHRAVLSLVLALLLAGSGLFLVGQMSKPAMSGTGAEPNDTLPDLAISHDDIRFSNDTPTDGDVIDICATVHNIGNASAQEVRVDFYDHFGGGSEKIATKWIPEIPPDSQETTCTSWTATPAGIHGIIVKVDPENSIHEWNEDNNVADRAIEVKPKGDLLPDLTIDGGIRFSNAHPKEGQVINICVTVVNIGDDGANNIVVLFADIFKAETYKIGTKTISHLGPGDHAEVCIEWKAQPAGEHVIFVKVDPENHIVEKNEDNNAADAPIIVEPLDGHSVFLTLVRFDNDGNGHVDDVVVVVYDGEHNAIVGAEVYIDGHFYGRTPDSGTLMAYNFDLGWHHVKVTFTGHTALGEFYSQG